MQKPNIYKHFRIVASVLVCSLAITVGGSVQAQTNAGAITNMVVSVDPTNGDSYYVFSLNSGGTAEVIAFADDVIRVRFSYNGFWAKEEPMIAATLGTWPTEPNTITDQGTNYLLQTGLLNVLINKNPFRVDFYDRLGGYALVQDDPTNAIQYNTSYNISTDASGIPYTLPSGFKLKCTKQMPANQAYFGFGEYPGPSNRRGANIMCWNYQSYHWGTGAPYQNPMYMMMPFFYGVQPANGSVPSFVYGIFFDNPCRETFRMGTQIPTGYSFEAADGQMDYYFFGGGTNHTMKAVINSYTELTGRPQILPKWALGHQLSRFAYDDQTWVEYIANTATASNIPLDAIYIDIDYLDSTGQNNIYSDQLHQLTMDTNNYPNPPSMVSSCAVYGVKLIPLIEPWLEPNDPYYGIEYGDLDFIKDNNGNQITTNIYVGNVSWFDYTSQPTLNRWQGDETNWFHTVAWGGIWNDLTEPEDNGQIPYNALLWLNGAYGSGTGGSADTRREWSNERNYFGLRSQKSSYTALLEAFPNRRPFVLSRSGTTGSQQYAAGWSGDTETGWNPNYLQACIRLGANVMISGQSHFGHDLGGFSGSTDGETITRWYEAGSVWPFYRSHSQNGDNLWSDGNQGREPWRFTPWQNWSYANNNNQGANGTNYCALMQKNIQFRYQLMPYLYTLMYNDTVNGNPINTPVVYNYYGDNNTLSLNEYDFLVGDFLLAAPVYTQGATTRTVYLPWPDDWYYYPTGTKYGGGQTVTVNAPLGTLPLFVRGGAIIPMGPSMQYANQFQPSYIDLNCWPDSNSTDANSSFTLYEDAGEGWDFTNGVYAMTAFTSSQTTSNWVLTIGARQGSYNPYSAGTRTFHVYANNPLAVQNVLLNGTQIGQVSGTNSPAPGWLVNTNGQLVVLVSETGSQQTVQVNWNNSDPYSSMTVAGTFNGWNQAANNMEYLGGRTWQYDASFSSVSNIQFKFAANGSWTTNWGGSGAAQTAPFSGVGILNASTNIVVSGTLNGLYQFTFNDETLDYSLEPLLASAYGSMNLPGTFNGWNPATNNMQLVANDTWQCIVGFGNVTNIQFKFAANGNWTSNWGENGGTQSQFGIPQSGAGVSNGSTNILINAVLNGEYQFTFNDVSLAYSVQLFTGDSVGDGIPDWWRAQYFSNGTNTYFGNTTNSQSCATCDPDGDGMNNLQEYLSGTVPTNSASFLHITSVTPQGTNMVVTWYTAGGHTNVVQAASGLPNGSYSNNFVDVSPYIIIQGSGDTTTNYTDLGAATNSPSRYYRVRLQQ
ncbi:MAG: TIM-barrel domain-containing protein [Verrucomicrobiia bacterium]|jgi:alpha-glucosidase